MDCQSYSFPKYDAKLTTLHNTARDGMEHEMRMARQGVGIETVSGMEWNLEKKWHGEGIGYEVTRCTPSQ